MQKGERCRCRAASGTRREDAFRIPLSGHDYTAKTAKKVLKNLLF